MDPLEHTGGAVEVDQSSQRDRMTFQYIWKSAMQRGGARYVHQVVAADPSRKSLSTINTCARIAMRFGDGFRQLMTDTRGMRVAILADGFGEFFPLYHGLWLAGCTVVPIPGHLAADIIAGMLNNADVRAVIYPPAFSARLAVIRPLASTVTEWILASGTRASPVGASRSVTRLDDVIQNSGRNLKMDDFPPPADDFTPALIAFSQRKEGEPHGVLFTEEALITAAVQQASLYFMGSEKERLTSLLPDKHIVSLIHMLIVPLVAGIVSVEMADYRPGEPSPRLVEELYDNQISAVWMSEEPLGDVRGATKSQRFVLPEEFRILLVPTRPLTPKHVEGIEKWIVNCYSQTEAGGVVYYGTRGVVYTCKNALVSRVPLIGAGTTPLSGVKIKIRGDRAESLGLNKVGEVVVSTSQVMSGYGVTPPGNTYLGPDLGLHTGDRALWSMDESGAAHLVIVGRDDDFVMRGGEEVNLFDLESVLNRVIGVQSSKVFGFPHKKLGHELAAFVIVKRKAAITQEHLWTNLLEHFTWNAVPKIFMIADGGQVTTIPPQLELQARLSQFSNADFSRNPKK